MNNNEFCMNFPFTCMHILWKAKSLQSIGTISLLKFKAFPYYICSQVLSYKHLALMLWFHANHNYSHTLPTCFLHIYGQKTYVQMRVCRPNINASLNM